MRKIDLGDLEGFFEKVSKKPQEDKLKEIEEFEKALKEESIESSLYKDI